MRFATSSIFVPIVSFSFLAAVPTRSPSNPQLNLNTEWQSYLKSAKEYHVDVDLFLEADLPSVPPEKIAVRSAEDIARQKVMIQRLKKLASYKPELLVQIQALEFETASYHGDYQEVINLGKAALTRDLPPDIQERSLFLTANAYLRSKNIIQAIETFESIIEHLPETRHLESCHLALADLYFKKNEYARALPHYEKVIQNTSSPYYARSLTRLGWSYYFSKYTILALQTMSKASHEARQAKLLYLVKHVIAYMLANSGGADLAQSAFSRETEPWRVEILMQLASIQFHRADWKNAEYTLRTLTKTYPKAPDLIYAHEMLLDILRSQDRRADFARELDRIQTLYRSDGPWYLAQYERPDVQIESHRYLEKFLLERVQMIQDEAKASGTKVDYARASVAFRNFLRQYPDSPHEGDVTFDYARSLHLSDQDAWAVEEYENVLKRHRKPEFVSTALLESIRSYEKLLPKKQAYASADLERPSPLKTDQTTLAPSRELGQPESRYVQLLSSNLNRKDTQDLKPIILLKRGAVYFANNQFSLARESLLPVSEKYVDHPKSGEAVRLLIQSYQFESKWTEVEEWCRKVLKRRGSKQLASLSPVELNTWLGESIYHQAEGLQSARKLKDSHEKFISFSRISPDSYLAPKALLKASEIALELGRIQDALKTLGRLATVYPNHDQAAQSLLLRGKLFEATFQFDLARVTFEQVHHRYPKAPESQVAANHLLNLYPPTGEWHQRAQVLEILSMQATEPTEKANLLGQAGLAYWNAGEEIRGMEIETTLEKQFPDATGVRIQLAVRNYLKVRGGTTPEAAQSIESKIMSLWKTTAMPDIATSAALAEMSLEKIRSQMKLEAKRLNPPTENTVQERLKVLRAEFSNIMKLGDATQKLRGNEVFGDLLRVYSKYVPQQKSIQLENEAGRTYAEAFDIAWMTPTSNSDLERLREKIQSFRPDYERAPLWNPPVAGEAPPVLPSADRAPAAETEQRLIVKSIQEGNLRKSEEYIKKKVLESSHQSHWAGWLAWIRLHNGQFAEARTLANMAVTLTGDQTMGWYAKGLVHLHDNQLEEAEKAFARAEDLQPSNGLIRQDRILNLIRLGRLKTAREKLQSLRDLPADPTWNADYVEGKINLQEGEFAEAHDDFQKVLQIQPQNLGALMSDAYVLSSKLKQSKLAKDLMQRAYNLEIRPDARREIKQWAERL